MGRRRTVIIAMSMGLFASLLSIYAHTATLSLARLILGTGGGVMNIAFGKMVSETIPTRLVPTFLMAHNGSVCIGFILVFGLAALLPDADDLQANKDDELWRVIWLAPAVIAIVEILLVLFAFPYEPVGFCMMMGRDEEGMLHLKRVYRKKNNNNPKTIE